MKSSVPSSEYSRHVHGRECRKMFWYFYDTLFMWLLGWATIFRYHTGPQNTSLQLGRMTDFDKLKQNVLKKQEAVSSIQ